jgi:hypothetical protein
MQRRALMGLTALVLATGPAWADWTDPEVAEVGDAQVRRNVEDTVWSKFEKDVAALQAQVAALDQTQRRAGVECTQNSKLRGIIGFREQSPGADCKLKAGGPIDQVRDAAKALFSDERLGPLAESSRQNSSYSGYGYGYYYGGPGVSSTYTTYEPGHVFDKLQQAESYGTIVGDRIWQDDVVGAGVALPEHGYEDRYLGGRAAQGFFQRMDTELTAAAEAVRSYRTQHREIAASIAGLIKEDNEVAAREGRGLPWDTSGEARFPHADLAGMHSSYAALHLPGNEEAHPSTVARIQSGYVWFTKYGVAAATGETPEPAPQPERETTPEVVPETVEREEELVVPTDLPVSQTADLLGTQNLYDVVGADDETTVRQPTSTEIQDAYGRADGFQNSTNLYSGLLPLYTTGAWQEGMTPENQAARELAARSLSREVNFMGLGLDASDPSRPRTDWDHGDELPDGVEIEDIEREREALLLTVFAVEPAALGQSLDLTGLGAIQNTEDAVGAFYGQATTIGQLRGHIGTHVRPATSHHRARIDGAAARLPPETLAKIQTQLDAYRQAHDEYSQALTELARFEGVNPLAVGDEPIPEDQRAAKAEAAWAKLQALQEAAGALSKAAQDAAQPAGGK